MLMVCPVFYLLDENARQVETQQGSAVTRTNTNTVYTSSLSLFSLLFLSSLSSLTPRCPPVSTRRTSGSPGDVTSPLTTEQSPSSAISALQIIEEMKDIPGLARSPVWTY